MLGKKFHFYADFDVKIRYLICSFCFSMRFHNPIYGIQQEEERQDHAVLLNPGEHEYCNPVEVFNKTNNRRRSEDSLMKLND